MDNYSKLNNPMLDLNNHENGYNNNNFRNPNWTQNENEKNIEPVIKKIKSVKRISITVLVLYLLFAMTLTASLIIYIPAMLALTLASSLSEEASPQGITLWVVGIILLTVAVISWFIKFILEIVLTVKVSKLKNKQPQFEDIQVHIILLILGIIICPICSIVDCFILVSKCSKALKDLK
ncbi:hypothetical protein D8X55_04430 [Malacoplasma penetrans]|uniref:MYPE2350 family membrane protein n=1 Tax=Malacoplasma penetrans TaxID=28227 RepID=UPI001010FBBE|nr:MYPE2350 family membrane protein [Malacoplasma penetrans]RXY96213.1 hypothetical protein D8X55_04430 [Malacoplasma penetrans]